jgi:SAM-dependent methyltransferase
MTTPFPIALACPRCRSPLELATPDAVRCPSDDLRFPRVDGIWRCLLPERAPHFAQFMREYETVRRGEGRGSDAPAYYRALPFRDLSGRFAADWRIRAVSYRAFVRHVLTPFERRNRRPLRILDLGAGNGWLSYHLARRGHCLAAVDLQTNRVDGLGAHAHYDAGFLAVQAEFDRLPFAAGQADVLVYNASFHFSEGYTNTLHEALRVLDPAGQIVILDSPIYTDPRSGEQMVREREAQFRKAFGFPSNALPSENFLTTARLSELAAALGLRWRSLVPFYGWRWAVRPFITRLRGNRQPARFAVLVAERA